MSIFNFVEKCAKYINWIVVKIIIFLAGIMTITVIGGVFFRYVLRNPLGWTEALARYLMIWVSLLAVSVGIRKKEHVRLEFIIRALPSKVAKMLNILSNILILLFLYELTKYGIDMAVSGLKQKSLALGITMFWPLASVPISAGLALLQQIFEIILSFQADASKKDILGSTEVDKALEESDNI